MSRLETYVITEITGSPLKHVKNMLSQKKGKMSKAIRQAKDMDQVTKALYNIFKNDKIGFTHTGKDKECVVPYSTYVCFGQSLQDEIEIVLTSKMLDKKFSIRVFIKDLTDIISHELIHRKQWEKFPDDDDKKEKGTEDDPDAPDWLLNIRYFSDPNETEAWAHTIYLDLKNGKYNRLREVLKILKGNQKMRKVFIKKLYQYSSHDRVVKKRISNFFKYAKKD